MKAPILTIAMLASLSSVPAMGAPVTCDKVLAKLKLSVADYNESKLVTNNPSSGYYTLQVADDPAGFLWCKPDGTLWGVAQGLPTGGPDRAGLVYGRLLDAVAPHDAAWITMLELGVPKAIASGSVTDGKVQITYERGGLIVTSEQGFDVGEDAPTPAPTCASKTLAGECAP